MLRVTKRWVSPCDEQQQRHLVKNRHRWVAGGDVCLAGKDAGRTNKNACVFRENALKIAAGGISYIRRYQQHRKHSPESLTLFL